MNVREIVTEWLKQHGYDGLYDGDVECGCIVGNLMPCDFDNVPGCKAGCKYLGDDGDWLVGSKEYVETLRQTALTSEKGASD